MKKLIALMFIFACSNESKLDEKEKKPERNFVCERVKVKHGGVECTPEFADDKVHTARVKLGEETIACGIANGQISVVCGDLIAKPQQPPQPETVPAAPPTSPKGSKKQPETVTAAPPTPPKGPKK